MDLLFLAVYLLLSSLSSSIEVNSTHVPRMVFTDKESTMKKLTLPVNNTPVRILVERDIFTAVGQKYLTMFKFQDLKPSKENTVLWKECSQVSQSDNDYNISVVHKINNNQIFVCGTNGHQTCCNLIQGEKQVQDIPPEDLNPIKESIKGFIIKEGEQSDLVFPESAEDAYLYITNSGSQGHDGIHKFGKNRVGPETHDKEQHYVGLVISRRRDDPSQNKVYAFYKEKNKNTDLYSDMWLPFVTQVCMADKGGPKTNLQFRWTSQMNAKLFCGDPDSRQHFSELVDVATVHADQWQDTRVYALFNNEWGISAVCVYTIQDIDNVFTHSPFKGNSNDKPKDRPRLCVSDSTKISLEVLRMIMMTSEMERSVRPVKNSGPLLINHRSYTHISADSLQHNQYPVLFLSLKSGKVHKVTQNESQAFVIAEYQTHFQHDDHIISITLHPSSRRLYVSSARELVILDVGKCTQYGDTCQECVLARDPYCGWNGTHCSSETQDTVQDVDGGNHTKCISPSEVPVHSKGFRHDQSADKDMITLPSKSKYFLQCPITSHHAQYTWHHNKTPSSCSWKDQTCLHMIDSMGVEHEGTYTCKSEEMGFSKVVVQFQLQLAMAPSGRSSSPLVLVCLMVALIKSVCCWS
ncbi:hypothetical protein PAMP_000856 [Pampus punctatissimus]